MTVTDLVRVMPAEAAEVEAVPVSVGDMAWMAGVIDVKGNMLRKNNKTRATPQFVLYAQCKDPRIARRMSALTGISPEPHQRAAPPEAFLRRNCTEHCPGPHVHVEEDDEHPWSMPQTTRWAITGIAAAVVLVNLAPFMGTYSDYVDDVSAIIRTFTPAGQGSGAVHKTLRRLSGLGWQIPAAVTVRIAEESADA